MAKLPNGAMRGLGVFSQLSPDEKRAINRPDNPVGVGATTKGRPAELKVSFAGNAMVYRGGETAGGKPSRGPRGAGKTPRRWISG